MSWLPPRIGSPPLYMIIMETESGSFPMQIGVGIVSHYSGLSYLAVYIAANQ
jgi:hypothetical protein